jgi:hypothetical protein
MKTSATVLLALGSLLLVSCGAPSSQPPPASPPPATSETSEAPSAEPPSGVEEGADPDALVAAKPDVEADTPQQVHVDEISVEGEGLTEEQVRDALGALHADYETCFSDTLASTPDATGRMSVTFLWVDGERKSVAASYPGPGAAELNSCFQRVSSSLTLSPPSDSGRVVVFVRLLLEPDA